MNINKLYYIIFFILIAFLSIASYNPDVNEFFINKVFTPQKLTNHKNVIKFNHSKHIEANMLCKDCHSRALTSVKSDDNLNPKKENCSSCHDVKSKNNCRLCHYENVYKKLKATDKGIIFAHKTHLEINKMECTKCHLGLDKVKFASESQSSFPSMNNCYKCHDNVTATNNCKSCHKNVSGLIPQSHLASNFLNEHKVVFDLEKSNSSENCLMCHSDNFCQACHSAGKYTGKNLKSDFYAPYYTKETGVRTDRNALQKLSNFHDLNYLYTHGLDANHKGFECKTCHDPVEFCSSCHQNNGNILTGFVPESHLQPDFKTIGVNTGGGLHASLAKKDIESCQSCHSPDGSDPVCLKCHFDNDGVKGTNPKTHEFGFMNDEKGFWHDTRGAVCYVCHTDGNARPDGIKGIGFCGYCHK